MTELLDFAAQLARGDMHPSHCVEDYRQGTGRAEFAAMASDYADRCRGKVRILKEAAERIAELERELAELDETCRNHEATAERRERELGVLLDALRWAMGTNGDFRPRREGEGQFWWRVELKERAGLVFAGEQYQPSARQGGE